jgi:hypothetical protein
VKHVLGKTWTQPYNRFNWASEIGDASLLFLPAARGDNGIGGGPREEAECPLDKPRECGPGGLLSRDFRACFLILRF